VAAVQVVTTVLVNLIWRARNILELPLIGLLYY